MKVATNMNHVHDMQRAKVNQNSWKLALKKQILTLEDSLAQLYQIANLKYNRIVVNETTDESILIEDAKVLDKHEISSYERIIEDYVSEVDKSAKSICALINCDVEFDLPIPVIVLLKLASKIGHLRWPDFTKKIPGTMAKKHIYNQSSIRLIQTSLTMFRWISYTMVTDVLPFQSLINEFYMNLLEWTRVSRLEMQDAQQYYWLRSLVLNGITWELAQFSLNLNYGPDQLKVLIGSELVDEVARALSQPSSSKENYVCDALSCLEWLFISYSKFLEAQLEFKLKNYVIHTCLEMYRNQEKSTISLACRRNLLRLLVTIANRPYATSSSELAWHIIELASKMETNLEMVLMARKAMDLGLAHRPVVATIRDYYDVESTCKPVDLEPELEELESPGVVGDTPVDSIFSLFVNKPAD